MNDFFRTDMGSLVIVFLACNGGILLAGTLLGRVIGNREKLRTRGYTEAHIDLISRQSNRAGRWVVFGGIGMQAS